MTAAKRDELQLLGERRGFEYARLAAGDIVRRRVSADWAPGCGWRFESTPAGWAALGFRVAGFQMPEGDVLVPGVRGL